MTAQGNGFTARDTFLVELEVLVATSCIWAAGYAAKRRNVLTVPLEEILFYLNRNVFTPCLGPVTSTDQFNWMVFLTCNVVFVKLAPEVNWRIIPRVAILPGFYVLQSLVSCLSCLFLGWAAGLPEERRTVAVASSICGSTDALILPLVLLLFENSQLLLSRRSPLRISDYSTVRGLTYIVVYQQLSQTALWIVDEWLLSELPSDRPDGQASGIRNLGSASVGGTGSHGQDVQGQCDHAATPSAEESSTPSATQSSSTPKDLSTSPIKPDCGSCVRGTAQSSLKSSKESGQGQKSRVSPDLGPSTAPPPDRENGASTDKPGSQRRYSRPGRGESMVLPISANGVTMNYWASCEPLPTPCLAREGDLRIFPELGPSSRLSRYSNCVRTKARATLRKAKKAIQDLGHNLPEPVDSVLKRLWAIATEMSRMARSFVAPSFAALVLATIVNSIPDLQDLFFRDDAFLQNSLVSAAEQVADLAVPTWLVLLGCRGSRSSTTCSPSTHVAQRGGESRLIFISLVSRMLLPVLFTGLFLALLTGNELALVFNDPSFSVVGILAAGSPIARELLHIFEEKNICQNIVPQIAHQAWSVGTLLYGFLVLAFAVGISQLAKGQPPNFGNYER